LLLQFKLLYRNFIKELNKAAICWSFPLFVGNSRWLVHYTQEVMKRVLIKKLPLSLIPMLLVPDVLSHGLFISTDCADPVSARPKVQSRHPTLMQQLAMNTNGTLAFDEPDDVRHRILWRNLHAQMDVINHHMAFQNFHFLLLTKIPKNLTNPTSQFTVDHFSAIPRNKHNVIFALPTSVRHRFKLFQMLFRLCPTGLSEEEHLIDLAGTAEPSRVARPEAVGLWGTKFCIRISGSCSHAV